MIRACLVVMLAVIASPSVHADASGKPGPWRMHQAARAPTWLRFGIEHRGRYEYLHREFRTEKEALTPNGYFMRTLVSATVQAKWFTAGLELADARAYATSDVSATTALINPAELLRAHVGWQGRSLATADDTVAIVAGLMTVDLGSRRLVARNEYRNTINGFVGVDATWQRPNGQSLRALAVAPMQRQPSDAMALADHAVKRDRPNLDALLTALVGTAAWPTKRVTGEAYVLGMHERDGTEAPSANRRLITVGMRLLRAPKPDAWDAQLETMAQIGTSRATAAATDATDLRHRAWSVHAAAGYRVATPWQLRMAALYDFASGDRNPNDDANQRFDPLFGARRFDFGPTGLYGALARTNLHSPGLRLEAAPRGDVDFTATYRTAWLAAARDAWVPAGLRDANGASGRFVGHQLEARVRWHVVPKNIVFEAGAARLIPGAFAQAASAMPRNASTLLYGQVTTSI